MFALVDCNNFFVSCERVFRPDLIGKPVVVMSNNDGCVISRSDEAKAIGIKMGEPIFKCKPLLESFHVEVFSANFSLYGDLSKRITSLLADVTQDVELYSIDESFLKFLSVPPPYGSYSALGNYIHQTILKCTGIPVSVGFGSTKTLAKLACEVAKKNKVSSFDMQDYPVDALLKTIDTQDVWGIGRKFKSRLDKLGIHTAFQFKYAPEGVIKQTLNVLGLQTQLELRGVPCHALETQEKPNKSIISSRSFGKAIHDLEYLKAAVAANMTMAAEKLRKQNLLAGALYVFIKTDRFKDDYMKQSIVVNLPDPTASTQKLVGLALSGLEKIYKKGSVYTKSGVMLFNLCHQDSLQYSLFSYDLTKQEHELRLMAAVDMINQKLGRHTIGLARTKLKQKPWESKQNKLSPSYTTDWNDIPNVTC